MSAWNTQQTCFAPSHRRHNHRTTGEKVDVSGELPCLMNDNDPVAVRWMLDFDLTGLNNVEVDICLTGPKDNLAINVAASSCHGLNHRNFCAGKLGECGFFFNMSHSVVLSRQVIG